MKEWTLADRYRGILSPEDRSQIMDLTRGCADMEMKVREIYRIAGR